MRGLRDEALTDPVITNREMIGKLTLVPEAHLGDTVLKKPQTTTNTHCNPKTTNEEKNTCMKEKGVME